MKLSRRRRSKYKELEGTTALTDIVFLLLIFFLLTSTFVTQTGIKIDLPGVKKPPLNKILDELSIAIDSNGRIFVDEDIIQKTNLKKIIIENLQKREQKTVIFRPDKRIKISQLTDVMDIANQAGATKLIIATKVIDGNE
jgi:biopolymer transport protein ExbD